MNNSTQLAVESEAAVSNVGRILISVVTGLPIFINIFYVVVCFKTFKKKFYNLLVLVLCIGDSILSLSLTWFLLVKLSNWFDTNVDMCLFQTFSVCYGLVFTHSIVFLVCYERYLVVKNYNFGVQTFFERFKYVIIGGTLSLGFMFTIETIWFVPHVKQISKCTMPQLYGKQFRFFIELIIGGLTLIDAGIIVCCIRTSMLIWRLFFKPSIIKPVTFTEPESITIPTNRTEQMIICSPFEGGYEYDHTVCQIASCEQSESDDSSITAIGESAHSESKKSESKEISKLIRQLITKMKKDRKKTEYEDPNTTIYRNIEKKIFKPDAWEKRAFITTIIIAMSTVVFTWPFIFSFWLDYFYAERFTSQVRLYLLVPLILNSIINPFIFAWRIPEIKQAIKKIFSS